jgi:PPM family protein phosphatase
MTMFRAAETIQRTDTGRQRRGNEDSSYARAPLFVVADGMGGAQAGEVASQIAVETFEQGLPDGGTAEERLTDVVQKANGRIHELSHSDAARAGMGTTLTAAYLDDDRLVIAHVGDSRAYLYRDGELTRLTQDHSLVDELFRQGKLTEEEALEHPQRSIITRALGPEPEVEVDTWSYSVREGDLVLLCSDGLTSMISDRQVQEVIAGAPTLQEAADRLIDAANEAGGRDNITVVMFRVEDLGGDGDDDQPTTIRSMSPVATATRSAASDRAATDRAATETPAPVPSPIAPDQPDSSLTTAIPAIREKPRRAPLARTQGHKPTAPGERHFGRLGKTVAATFATLCVILLVGGGGYLASRQLYFLGTNGQGTVVVFRGLPYVLPFGIPMYETFYVSGVPASLIPPDRRSTLLNHDLRSQTAAQNLINSLERGKISG